MLLLVPISGLLTSGSVGVDLENSIQQQTQHTAPEEADPGGRATAVVRSREGPESQEGEGTRRAEVRKGGRFPSLGDMSANT